MASDTFRFFRKAEFKSPSMIVCWDPDSGRVGPEVVRHLNEQLRGVPVCDIRPMDFFALGGVVIEDDVARFPQTRLYYSREPDLLVLHCAKPQFQHYEFLTAVLDLAEHYCKVKELFTIHGIVASVTHTAERRILAVFTNGQFQKQLRPPGASSYNLQNMDYEGFPAIGSYLLWMARKRNIPAVNLWPEIPFYFSSVADPKAIRAVVAFFDERLQLDFDFRQLDEEIELQNTQIAALREENPQIDESLRNLESGLSLSEEEQLALIDAVGQLFARNRNS